MTISAKIIADSVSPAGKRITTFELEYPRFIHAEFMTHRMFSRNAASSRAIPVERQIELIRENTAMPIHWGKNQPGMSAKEECNNNFDMPSKFSEFVDPDDAGWSYATRNISRESAWHMAKNAAIEAATAFHEAGYHKQIVNRLLEPFAHIKVVCTATEYDNFFWLRRHPDAQPEIHELANQMWAAREKSTPRALFRGDWHVPYFKEGGWCAKYATHSAENYVTLEDAIAISASCCAQVSYRTLDDSIDKARAIYKRLVESAPVHASPFEHQATPFPAASWYYQPGATGVLGNCNFYGWEQFRQQIPNNVCWNYKP